MKKSKRIISLSLILVMFISQMSTAFASSGLVNPAGNPTGSEHGAGTWSTSAVMMKAYFFSPDEDAGMGDGVDYTNAKGTPNVVVGLGEFHSLTERSLYEIGTKKAMSPIDINYNSEDSFGLCQAYGGQDSDKYTHVSILGNGEILTSMGNSTTGHTIISPRATQDVIKKYEGSDLFTMNSLFMKELLDATDKGKNWDVDKINACIDKLWKENVVTGGSGLTNPTVIGYRQALTSLFADYIGSPPKDNQSMEASMAFLTKLFEGEKIWDIGGKPLKSTFAIDSKEQAANIQNLFMINIAIAFGNPSAGLRYKNSGELMDKWNVGYKYDVLKSSLQKWVTAGGNSKDNTKLHFAWKFESYGIIRSLSGQQVLYRWDLSFQDALKGSGLTSIVKPSTRLGFKSKYSLGNIDAFSKEYTNAMLTSIKSDTGKWAPFGPASSGDKYSQFTAFQYGYPNDEGTAHHGGGSSRLGWRGLLEYTCPAYEKGSKTVNLGFSFWAPRMQSDPVLGDSKFPNPKMNSMAFTDVSLIPLGQTGKATSYFDMLFPTISDADADKYSLKGIKDKTKYDTPATEAQNLTVLIERCMDTTQLANPGDPNKSLPVKLTIKRSFVNPGPGSDTKIIDNDYKGSTIAMTCAGNHNFKITDNGTEAVITFNIIPSSNSKCSTIYEFPRYTSKLLESKGKKGQDALWMNPNCVVSSLFQQVLHSRIKFDDENIPVTETPGGKTTVNYDFSYTIQTPTFIENKPAYGEPETDKMRNATTLTGLGYNLKPTNGAVYPASDWTYGYDMSPIIRRSVTFTRETEVPSYTNVGYEKKNPYYSEIKQGGPTNEPFEAMAGTPTTRDLYMSVSGTDFRVDFKAAGTAIVNPATERIYTYTITVTDCHGADSACTFSDPPCDHSGCSHGGEDPVCSPVPCGASISCGRWSGTGCVHNASPENKEHPLTHVYTYVVHVPIETFTYFDMTDSEVWRLTQYGLNGGTSFLTSPNPTWNMDTKVWALNVGNYTSGNGRIVFSEVQNKNNNGNLASYGDNVLTDTLAHSAPSCEAGAKKAMDKANGYLSAEKPFNCSFVSDYIVLKTSEGYQIPYFHTQDSTMKVSPNSVKFESVFGDSKTTTNTLKVSKELTIDELWFKNSSKLTAATKANGWTNSSITYAGYNGGYQNLATKYKNDAHKSFLNTTNTFETMMKKMNLTVDSYYPNQKVNGSGSTTFGKDAGNTDHIKTGLDIVDTTPNNEYNTGESWLQYDRIMFYERNTDMGEKSGTPGVFDMTGPGVWRNESVPYFEGASKINDIVIHDPVSAQDAFVERNDLQYDKRTNAALMQGGDPGYVGGVCPQVGCLFSKLTCTHSLSSHVASCYQNVQDQVIHIGGNNAHVHNTNCYHNHTSSCNGSSCSSLVCMTTGRHVPNICPLGHGCSGCNPCHDDVNGGGSSKWYHNGHPLTNPRWWNGVQGHIDGVFYCDYGDSHGGGGCNTSGFTSGPGYNCGYSSGQLVCTNIPNSHVCMNECQTTYKKALICSDPHHYEPGEPTDITNPRYHYPIGDNRCWTRCGNDKKHGSNADITLPDGGTAVIEGVFINLDREFKIHFPFSGDFAKDPSMEGIQDTTDINGKGYINDMDTREWTDHRWVLFPYNVIDPAGNMVVSNTWIDLNKFSTTEEVFTFYCVLANYEVADCLVKFTATAINAPVENRDEYFIDSSDETNIDRLNPKYGANHTAYRTRIVDVVGSIGALTLNDTGDYRFSNLFKQAKNDGSFLIPNLVPEVFLNVPNFVLGDKITSRLDNSTLNTRWLDTYGNMFNQAGGKSGGTGNAKAPLLLPLVPRYNNIPSLRNQPMRPGYQMFFDTETSGNYYGENYDPVNSIGTGTNTFLDSEMINKMQIRPLYYSLNMDTGVYTPVDVYYGVNGEYMQVNSYNYDRSNGSRIEITATQPKGVDSGWKFYSIPGTWYVKNINIISNDADQLVTVGSAAGGSDIVSGGETGTYKDLPNIKITDGIWVDYGGDLSSYDFSTLIELSLSASPDGSSDELGVKDYYYYLDWLNESARRNFTNAESTATANAKSYRKDVFYRDETAMRSPGSERDVLGSANTLFLNDLNRTFIGSSNTYGKDNNPGSVLTESWYNAQSQRWHFTVGLPSSSVFVEAGKPCTEANIEALRKTNRVIVGTLDILVRGQVWTLQYDGSQINANGFQIYEGGTIYQPPKFDENGKPTTDPDRDVTTDDPVVVVYPPDKTSKDDVKSGGIQ